MERGAGVSAEEAVRIFLEFKRVESAIKGIAYWFGGFYVCGICGCHVKKQLLAIRNGMVLFCTSSY